MIVEENRFKFRMLKFWARKQPSLQITLCSLTIITLKKCKRKSVYKWNGRYAYKDRDLVYHHNIYSLYVGEISKETEGNEI